MIKIESIKIENFRGIHCLELEPNRKSLAIQGPNASGKSCVVDAIEFALTGDLSRLAGEGTRELSLTAHGMHVDSRTNPNAAQVTLRLFVKESNVSFSIVRSLGKPSKPKLSPDNAVTRAALERFGTRDEITLTRRQISKYVLAQASKRASDVQNLLRLDSIGNLRKVFASAEKKAGDQAKSASGTLKMAIDEFERHLQIPSSDSLQVIQLVNEKRLVLGLEPISQLSPDDILDKTGQDSLKVKDAVFRQTALRDLEAFKAIDITSKAVQTDRELNRLLDELENDPKLNNAARSAKLYDLGMDLLAGDSCPLCDTPMPIKQLREHLNEKLRLSKRGAEIAQSIATAVSGLQAVAEEAIVTARPVYKLSAAMQTDSFSAELKNWVENMKSQLELLSTLDGIIAMRKRILSFSERSALETGLSDLTNRVEAIPDQSATIQATQHLALTAERLKQVRTYEQAANRATKVYDRVRFVHQTYSSVYQKELESLYQSVEGTFADAYRSLHPDDESAFNAKLTPEEGKLDLGVDFYGRGFFPPAAYHSEGHQDSMGLCLYLSLMQHVFGDELTLVVLDDVVMSVDSGHRRALCEMLINKFPNTQFIITTHEELWFYQMQSAGLICKKNAKIFHSWSVDKGPVVSDAVEAWDQIQQHLEANSVPSASLALRRHLEQVLPQIADALAASPPFRIDGKHDLGELKSACYVELKKLLNDAVLVAKAWGDKDKQGAAEDLLGVLVASIPECDKESKYVTATIHFNDWAKLVKQDFVPVVRAFKSFLDCFKCPRCNVWLSRSSRHQSKSFACNCGAVHFPLVKPTSEQKEALSAASCSETILAESPLS